tara:strand:+ start:891 stop:1697 length:807 start_codon:yes stop_codon:yes gene_type:complete
MKNLVISRKGFDASAGGRASPIFANGDIFSVPIPQKKQSPSRYRELQFNDMSGREILNLIGAKSISINDFYHNDPLLSRDKGIFGQAGGSQGELDNCEIGQGDLFLFFGWFKQYHLSGPNLHHLFGWLQIEKIIKGNSKILKFLSKKGISHPHGTTDRTQFKNNTLYIASKKLTFSDSVRDIKGHGVFKKTAKSLILTEKGKTRSRWRFPKKYFSNTKNLFRNRLKWKDEEKCLVNCSGIGQEFILNAQDNPSVVDWASYLLNTYGRD